MERPSLHVLSPSSPGMLQDQDAPQLMPGQLSVSVCIMSVLAPLMRSNQVQALKFFLCVSQPQVKLWYDKVGHQLMVNVQLATELPLRPDGRPRSPYVKMYFLPDRRYAASFKRCVQRNLNNTRAIFLGAPQKSIVSDSS